MRSQSFGNGCKITWRWEDDGSECFFLYISKTKSCSSTVRYVVEYRSSSVSAAYLNYIPRKGG